ncbi:putative endonuclease [Hyphomicrobium sp. 1Nfss2.1]
MKTLVYFEEHDDIEEAIRREKRIKRWRRAWKIALIEGGNPGGATCGSIVRHKVCHSGRVSAANDDPGPSAGHWAYDAFLLGPG